MSSQIEFAHGFPDRKNACFCVQNRPTAELSPGALMRGDGTSGAANNKTKASAKKFQAVKHVSRFTRTVL